jgi:hypothetical protein
VDKNLVMITLCCAFLLMFPAFLPAQAGDKAGAHEIRLIANDVKVKSDGAFMVQVEMVNNGKTPWTISKDFHGLPTILSWSLEKESTLIKCPPMMHTMEMKGPCVINPGKSIAEKIKLDLRDFEKQPPAGEWTLRARLDDGTASKGIKITIMTK